MYNLQSVGVGQDVLVLGVGNPWRESNPDLCQKFLTEVSCTQAVPVQLLGLYLPIYVLQTCWVQFQLRAS